MKVQENGLKGKGDPEQSRSLQQKSPIRRAVGSRREGGK